MTKKIIIIISIILSVSSMAYAHSTTFAANNCQANINGHVYRCSLGKTGVTTHKQEGDGATPAGTYPLRKVFYRPDKIKLSEISTKLPIEPLSRDKGWCDDPKSASYNQEITLPFALSHEQLWRADDVYDLIVVVGYNDQPVTKNKGSAIFIHIARDGYPGTAGCIAFEKNDLLKILHHIGPNTVVNISPTNVVTFSG